MTNVSSNTAAVPDALRDIKPPVEVFDGWRWIWLSLAGVLLVALVAYMVRLISLLLQERRKLRPQERALLPQEIAQKAFEAALAFLNTPRQFGIVISDALRQYLEQRFQLRAPERTTEEFLLDLQKTVLLTPDQKETLKEFLGHCDLIKFSKHEPAENELRALHSTASILVESTKDVPTPTVNIVVDTWKLQRQKQGKRMAIVGFALQSAPILWLVLFGRALPSIANLFVHIATNFSWNLKELLQTFNALLALDLPAPLVNHRDCVAAGLGRLDPFGDGRSLVSRGMVLLVPGVLQLLPVPGFSSRFGVCRILPRLRAKAFEVEFFQKGSKDGGAKNMTFAHLWVLSFLLLLPVLAWLKGKRGSPPAFLYSSVQLVRAVLNVSRSRSGGFLAALRWLALAAFIIALKRNRASPRARRS